MNRDVRHLRYILFCIEQVEEYTGIGKAALESQLLLDAIERNLEKLADTAGRLSEEYGRLRRTSHGVTWATFAISSRTSITA